MAPLRLPLLLVVSAALLLVGVPAAAQAVVDVPEEGDVGDPQAAPRPPRADAGEAGEAGVTVRVRPTHVTRQGTVRFGDDGAVQQRNGSMSLQFVAEVGGGGGLLATALPAVAALETLLGEPLTLRPDGQRGPQTLQEPRGRAAEGGGRTLSFSVAVAEPPAARGIRSARGTIHFVAPDGPLRELRFVPLDRFTGRTAVVEDLGDAAFGLEAEGPNALQLAFPEELERHLVEVALADAGGGLRVLERGRWNTWRRDGRAHLRLRGEEVPAGGGLVVRLYPALREVVVPWSCGPFDLPVPGGDAGPRLAMRTSDPAAPMAAAEPREAGPEEMPMRVLGE